MTKVGTSYPPSVYMSFEGDGFQTIHELIEKEDFDSAIEQKHTPLVKTLRPISTEKSKKSETKYKVHQNSLPIPEDSQIKPIKKQKKVANNFWDLVAKDYTCVFTESEALQTSFNVWIFSEEEQEEREYSASTPVIVPRNQKKKPFEIYESAFIETLDHFIWNVKHQTSLSKFEKDIFDEDEITIPEYKMMDYFDILDTKRRGTITRDVMFMILVLHAAKESRSLVTFL